MSRSTRALTAAVALTTAAAPFVLTTTAHAAGDLFVATTGLDSNSGAATSPLRTVQAAVNKATPGTTIRIMPGSYYGNVKIKTSGTASAPIRITAQTPGTVTLTYNSRPETCSNSQPAGDRTITIGGGADYWQIDNLKIHNGIYISGQKANSAYSWLTNLVNKLDWSTRRKVPGHGAYNPSALGGVVPHLRNVTGVADINAAEGNKIIGNTMTGRGIYGALASNGTISGNTISKIPCGIGPGIWMMTFSNNNKIFGNDISDIAISHAAHYMQEGIRVGSAADYNEIYDNYVHDLPGDGRGINTDVDGSWNHIHHNRVANVAIGYNDQMSGWGNRWEYNTVTNYRVYGMGFRLMDARLAQPSKASSSNGSIVRCNNIVGPVGDRAKALGVGAMMNGKFQSNNMPLIWISKNMQTYWSAQGNTWNGSSALPSKTPTLSSAGC